MRRQRLLVTAAALIGLSAQVLAGFFDGSTDFEGDNPLADALWGNVGGAVTQSVTATFSPTDVTAKFFKAVIEFPISEEPDEPEPDPEE